MRKLERIELREYIDAMKTYARSVNADYILSINTSFIEMWDSIEREDEEYEHELQIGFFQYRDAYLDTHDIDIDILAFSFIKDGGFGEYLNSDT